MKKIFTLLYTFYFLLFPILVNAQLDAKEQEELKKERELYQLQIQQELFLKQQALEGTIDPNEYMVGPGDVFMVNLWGLINENFTIAVSPEGNLIIPTVSEISVKGLNLSEVKERIIQETKKVYLDSKINVNLIKIRNFRVSVTGGVTYPGSYIVAATARVSEAISSAGGFWKMSEQEGLEMPENLQQASWRNIQLLRDSGEKIPVDLLSYRTLGDKSQNPLLLDGDVIYVPFIQENIGFVEIYGAVNKPGKYEYKKGDKLSTIINLAHGLREDADKANCELNRFVDGKKSEKIKLNLEEDREISLQPDDRIFVRSISEYHEKKLVEIKGEVKYPGLYPIQEGETRLSEVVALAGGFTESASLKESKVLRDTDVHRKMQVQLVEAGQEEISTDREFKRLREMQPRREMTDVEYAYLKAKFRQEEGVLAVDFVKLFQENEASQDILLQDGDIIEINSQSRLVKVIGAVDVPGITSFEDGKSVGYYVEQCGGYSHNADKGEVRLIKAVTGKQLEVDENQRVEIGDTIFVPEKPERDYWLLFREVVLITSQIATVALVIQNITNKN